MKNAWILILALILIGAAFVRVWNLSGNPAGFFADEASVGYNAYSILMTGTDEFGQKFPLFFRAFGEYKNPLDIYATVPFIAAFGLTEEVVRMSSAFFGILTVGIFFLIGRKYFGTTEGLLAAFVLAISPWHIHLSRINMEGFTLFLFFLSLTILCLDRLNLFAVFSAIATYAYFPSRIVVPIFFITTLFIVAHKKRNWQKILFPVGLFAILIIPLTHHMVLGEGRERFNQVSVFNNKEIHPPTKIARSYALHFSPDFLFTKGDIDMPGQFITRHSVRGVGELYWWQLPFIFIGLFVLFQKNKQLGLIMIALLSLYPIPSSLTTDISPQATRALTGIIPFSFLTAIGMTKLLKHRVIAGLMSIIIGASVLQYGILLSRYPHYSSDFWGWQMGPRSIMTELKARSHLYEELYMTGAFNAPEIFIKFYDPRGTCQNCFIGGTDRLDPTKKQFFALTPDEVKAARYRFTAEKTLYYPDGEIAFYLGEFAIL